MIHIVFNENEIQLMEQVIALDETLEGNIIQIQDDYAVGPIENLYTAEGAEARNQWWGQVLEGTENYSKWENNEINDAAKVEKIIASLKENDEEIVWIWCAQNKHDVSGYYWLMSQLKDFQSRVFILYLNNLPFFNEKGQMFYPEWLSQIPAKEFLKAKKLARAITLSEFEVDPDEWHNLGLQNKMVRLLEGGKKLIQKEEDFYDNELLSFTANEFQKVTKVVNNFLTKVKVTTGDAFLYWRIKAMILNETFETQNVSGKVKDFEIRKKGSLEVQSES